MDNVELIGAFIGFCMLVVLGMIVYGLIGWAVVAMLSVFIPSIPITFGSVCAAGGLLYFARWVFKR